MAGTAACPPSSTTCSAGTFRTSACASTRGGPRDAPVNRLVKQVEEITPATEATARLAGSLLGSAGRNATVDALVVAEAAPWRKAVILTTDAKDLSALAADLPGVRVLAV